MVGLTFFYQSWNHRASTLKVSSDYWDKGYVLFPNKDDQKISLEKRAGHSILIVGWDDTLEVPKLDKDGEVVKDSTGEPILEKGFFLFKNSWGTGGFGKDNAAGDGYGWLSMAYVAKYGRGRVSGLPKLNAPNELKEQCDDAIDNDNNGKIDCEDEACNMASICANESKEVSITNTTSAIPDNDPKGAELQFEIEDIKLESMVLTLKIKHTYTKDLSIEIVSPEGNIFKVLKENIDAFVTEDTQRFAVKEIEKENAKGSWKLRVIDHSAVDVGNIEKASVTIRVKK